MGRRSSDELFHRPDEEELLGESVKRIKAANTDVVLLDLQYAPLVLANNRYIRMEKIIADVAGQQKVGHFPRFILMKRAIDAGVGMASITLPKAMRVLGSRLHK
jgi:acyl-CoA thioesterase I